MNQNAPAAMTTTDPATALLMLYQGAIDSPNRAQNNVLAGAMAEKGRHIFKANDIINQFIASPDHDVGGEIAQTSTLYTVICSIKSCSPM